MFLLVAASLFQSEPAPAPVAAELVEIVPGPKRYFHAGDERNGCPAPTTACRRKGYVVPGDRLVAWETRGPLTRVTYLAPRADTPVEGWVESAGLRPVAPAPLKAADWLGGWRVWDADIDIAAGPRSGTLHIGGNATYGARDPERVKRGAVNTGGFDADIPVPQRDRASVTDSGDADCRVAMRLLPPYLVVADNGRCGGVGVTFDGVYRK